MKSYRNNSQGIKRDAASYSCCLSPPFRWEAGQWLPTIPYRKLSHAKQPDASVTFISCTTTVSAPCKLRKRFYNQVIWQTDISRLTSEQVLTGWLFYYDSWKNEPVIRIKSNEARRLLDIKGQYASVKDLPVTPMSISWKMQCGKSI